MTEKKKQLFVVGLGSGRRDSLTIAALETLQSCEVIVGYKKYLQQIEDIIEGKETYTSGMKKEIERCEKALEYASEGRKVAIVSSGESGIFGMAGPILQLKTERYKDVDVKVLPGITAMNLGAAALGAPLMHDIAIISLSDLLTPWEVIEKRIHSAGQGDFVIALYNPRSKGRPHLLRKTVDILREYRKDSTPIGVVQHAGRDEERVTLASLNDFDDEIVDMNSIVIIGNSHSYGKDGLMLTPRGYGI